MQTSFALARAPLRHGWRGLVGIVVLMVAELSGLVPIRAGLRHQPAKMLCDE